MKRNVLTRQRGQRHLSMLSIEEEWDDDNSSRQTRTLDDEKHPYVFTMMDEEERMLPLDTQFSKRIARDRASVRLSWQRGDTFDTQSRSSATSAGMPSLSSINAESIAPDYISVQSNESNKSFRSLDFGLDDDDDLDSCLDDDLISLASDAAQLALSRLQLRDEDENLLLRASAAETIDVLCPVVHSYSDEWKRENRKWSSYEPGLKRSSSFRKYRGSKCTNDDESPTMSLRSMFVRARSMDLSQTPRVPPAAPARISSLDSVPFVPRRQTSIRHLDC
eukprot:Nitzschia sp. Nitz4//scaffold109_size72162//65637//66470//NITZ4_005858-RA/size72162-processed-gene-0.24-mRNA-1//1//CDS//3329532799//2633//frame0